MNALQKLIKADVQRKTRMHDLRGNFVGWSSLATSPLWFLDWTRVRCGNYPRLPWIPPSARRRLMALAKPNWTILECGSGMSTLWWASRVAKVVALETDPSWYGKLRSMITQEGLRNVDLHLVEDYEPVLIEKLVLADLVVIDGYQRDKCARVVVDHVNKPTWVYLDNTDFAALQEEMRLAEEELLGSTASAIPAEYFLGVPPGLLAPTQSMLKLFGGQK